MFSGLVFAEKESSELDQQLWRVNFLPVQRFISDEFEVISL